MTHQEVNDMEDSLRDAERSVERAAQLMSSCPMLTPESGSIWGKLNHVLCLIGECIHGAYVLRPGDGQEVQQKTKGQQK